MSSEVDQALKATKHTQKETLFDKILSKQLPADIIFEDDKCLAFNDINPQAPTHFLIIPKKRIPKLDDSKEVDKDVMKLVKNVFWCLEKLFYFRSWATYY